MNNIGFSTGAIALGDFELALSLLAQTKIDIVEISALHISDFRTLVEKFNQLDLKQYRHVSIHAPTKPDTIDEDEIIRGLLKITSHNSTVIVHPDIIKTHCLWKSLGSRLVIENNDQRKLGGQTPEDLLCLSKLFPEARFCIDIAHALIFDNCLLNVIEFSTLLRGRIAEIHVSGIAPNLYHCQLSRHDIDKYKNISHILPPDAPIIIESPIEATVGAIISEYNSAKLIFS